MNSTVPTVPSPGISGERALVDDLGRARRRRSTFWWIVGLTTTLVISMVAGISLGPVSIRPATVWQVVGHHMLSWPESVTWTTSEDNIVWLVRFPRVLLGAVVGAALAAAGVALQALVRNMLADPFLLGISSGASAAAAATILFGFGAGVLGASSLSLSAFAGALAATALVFMIARIGGTVTALRLVLAGVAIAYALAALTSFLIFASDSPQTVGTDPVVLTDGHVDAFEISLEDGRLRMMLKDGTVFGETVFRDPADVLFQAVPESAWELPDWVGDRPEFAFLGEPGDLVYLLPDIQEPGLLWPGSNTERLSAADVDGLVELAITEVGGPGALKLYTIDDFGSPGAIMVDSADDEVDGSWDVFVGSHAHFNWVFTAAGSYTLTAQATATLAGGGEVSTGPVDYHFVVGELPDDADLSQTIVATIDEADGALVVSVDPDDRTVGLPAAELSNSGDRWVSVGELRPVTVTDTRPATPGWNVAGQVSDFAGDAGGFEGRFLGWLPEVLSQADGQGVTPGAAVPSGFESGDGLGVSQSLGSANAGQGLGTARLGAELTLELPTETLAGQYVATLTLTAI